MRRRVKIFVGRCFNDASTEPLRAVTRGLVRGQANLHLTRDTEDGRGQANLESPGHRQWHAEKTGAIQYDYWLIWMGQHIKQTFLSSWYEILTL